MKGKTLKPLMVAACMVWIMAFIGGCATMKANPQTTKTLANTAGMETAMSFKQDKAKVILSSACAVHLALNDYTNPELAQKFIKDDLAKIWDEAYSQGLYSVCTVLNGLVSYMQLQTSEPTQESIELWKQCMSEFCAGVDQVWEAEAKRESTVYRFLPGYASRDTREGIRQCALIGTGRSRSGCE